MSLGTPHLHLRVTDSTNARAKALAVGGAPHGTLVSAAEQSAGRGRQGRSWAAPPGSALLMSLILRDPAPLLPLRAAVAVAQIAGTEATIKWPNDILLAGKKVAGILIEGRPQEHWAVLGIGLNVAVRIEDLPAELHAQAATLALDASEIDAVLARLLSALEHWLVQDAAGVLTAWRMRDALKGRDVSWSDGRGVASGIDSEGRLLVETGEHAHRVLEAGEVHLLA